MAAGRPARRPVGPASRTGYDQPVDEPPPPRFEPGEQRPEPGTRLDRAPGERFEQPRGGRLGRRGAIDPSGSPARAVVSGSIAALIAVVVFVVFAGPLAFSAGLVIIAVFAGRTIGLVTRTAAGPAVTSDTRVVIALLITIGWFVLAQLAVWVFARFEGGVLAPLDYLAQTFGPLVPIQLIVAVLVAWWSAR